MNVGETGRLQRVSWRENSAVNGAEGLSTSGMRVVTIETDAAGATALAEASGRVSDAVFDTRQVQAQVGDPDTWMYVAHLVSALGPALGAVVEALLRQRKIKYIKVGDREFRDITAAQLTEVIKLLEDPPDDQPG